MAAAEGRRGMERRGLAWEGEEGAWREPWGVWHCGRAGPDSVRADSYATGRDPISTQQDACLYGEIQ